MDEDRDIAAGKRLASIRAHLIVAMAAHDLMRRGPTGSDRDRGTTEYVTRIDAIFDELVALENAGALAALERASAQRPGVAE